MDPQTQIRIANAHLENALRALASDDPDLARSHCIRANLAADQAIQEIEQQFDQKEQQPNDQ